MLCFENYEITCEYLAPWLTQIRDYDPSSNIRLAIASRILPGPALEPLTSVLAHIKLDVFSVDEANEYLDSVGIFDEFRRNEILEFSNRLPVLMSWLASPSSIEPDPELPSSDIVDRFLRWVKEPNLKSFALEASIPRFFNLDILGLIFPNIEESDLGKGFEWLIEQPYVFQKEYGWIYHEVVHRLMVNYLRSRSLNRYQSTHQSIVSYYQKKIDDLKIKPSEKWHNQNWQEYTIELIYHKLLLAPDSNWDWIFNLFVRAIKHNRKLAQSMIDVLNQPIILDNLSTNQTEAILFIAQYNLLSRKAEDLFKLYEFLYNVANLDVYNKSHILFLMGKARIISSDHESARKHFDQAIKLDPNNYFAITWRGVVFFLDIDYEKALEDFKLALKIEKYPVAFHFMLDTFLRLGKYDQIFEILGKDNDINCSDCLTIRAGVYNEIGQYNNAIIDLNRSLEISPDNYFAMMRRGEIYLELGEYSHAIADFEQVMEEEEDYLHECLKDIGLVFFAQEKYDDSIKKIIEALKIVPACTYCWSSLLVNFEKLYSRDEVIFKFSKSNFPDINFSPIVYISRAQALLNGDYYQAFAELEAATQLNPTLDTSKYIALNDLGLFLGRNEQYEAAIKCFKKDMDISDYIRNYNIAISFALWKGYNNASKYIDEAIESLTEVKNKDSNQEGVYTYGLAGFAAVKEDKSLAIDLLNQAYTLDPSIAQFVKIDPAWNFLRRES